MKSNLTPKQLILITTLEKTVAPIFHLDEDEYTVIFRSNRRDNQASHARQFLWYILYEKIGLTSTMIGNTYGKKHSTVLHGITSLKKRPIFKRLDIYAKAILNSDEIIALRS